VPVSGVAIIAGLLRAPRFKADTFNHARLKSIS